MRDKLRTKDYFDAFILEESEDIEMFERSLAEGEIDEDRLGSIKDEILLIKIGVIIAKYSRGDSISSIKQEFESLIDLFCESWDGEVYEDNLCFASLAFLLGLNDVQLTRIRNKLMTSDTYDFVMEYVLTGSNNDPKVSKISFPRSYRRLKKCIDEKDIVSIKKYLRGWYKGSQDSSWYDTHRIEDDNLYFGYWCFEAGAVAKRLGFPDDDLRNEPYYPYDMVHF